MSKHEYICIVCPQSCRITVEDSDNNIAIYGFGCKHGKEHAYNEYCNPKRLLTTTIKLKNGISTRLPVISSQEIPKADIEKCLDVLYKMEVSAPINCYDTVIQNICGTNVDILAARTIRLQDKTIEERV